MTEITFEKLNGALKMFEEYPKDVESYINLSAKSKRKLTSFQRKKSERKLFNRYIKAITHNPNTQFAQKAREIVTDDIWGLPIIAEFSKGPTFPL